MLNIAAMLDAYGVVGKTVFLANEIPTGVALGYNETYTVPAGGGTYTTAHAATYAKDWYVSYLPTPGGTKDGVTLTKVASNPGAGQYSVTAGAYTFSAADAGARVLVNYYWYASGKGGNTPYHVAVHNWLSSRAANFVDTGNTNIDYGIPGALYGRPWVVSVDTWGAMADPSAPTQNDGRVLTDGLHPSVTGCMVIAEAFAEQIRKHLPSADFSHLATMPTTYVGTPSSGLGNGVIKTFTGTYPKTPISSGTFSITAAGIVASDNNGSLAGAGVTTGTINYSTGAYSVTFDAAPALNTPVVVTADSGQLLVNNFLYFAGSGSVTSILGCSTECQNSDNLTSSNGTGKPAIFTTSLDSTTGGSAGPLATGAMKIDIVENDTSSDGYPELVVKLSGMTGSSKLTLTLSQPAIKNLTVGSK
jgi:hypothetical protein